MHVKYMSLIRLRIISIQNHFLLLFECGILCKAYFKWVENTYCYAIIECTRTYLEKTHGHRNPVL